MYNQLAYTCEDSVMRYHNDDCRNVATFKILTGNGDVYACDTHLINLIRASSHAINDNGRVELVKL